MNLRRLLGVVIATCALALLARSAPAELVTFQYHDGQPAYPLSGLNEHYLAGSFMYPIQPASGIWYIPEFSFYHGGDYPDSGQYYEVWLCARLESEDLYALGTSLGVFTTTCNDCWEHLSFGNIPWNFPSDEDESVGIFVRPLSGSYVQPAPVLWGDAAVDHEHISVVFDYYETEPRNGDRDHIANPEYMSDFGLGEILLTVTVSLDEIVAVEPTSWSAIKSLY
ncbi:MAG: hypothetical protein R3C71_05460 [Candidatus Krumholzibacteriia bacterium]|nr:hypothetical protein [Candidatus Latescibacterota bacterium]